MKDCVQHTWAHTLWSDKAPVELLESLFGCKGLKEAERELQHASTDALASNLSHTLLLACQDSLLHVTGSEVEKSKGV